MLFDQIVYGPIHSRRLGISLGINLMPVDAKVCTFDCVYCECGYNNSAAGAKLPTRDQVREALELKLSVGRPWVVRGSSVGLTPDVITPDVITFSGNGEPTLHPDFLGIIEDTCRLRDLYCPQAKVSVLSNSTQLGRPDVVQALRMCDNRILKLDSAIDHTMRLIDQPVNLQLTVQQIVDWLRAFDGDFTLQTCFLRGKLSAHYGRGEGETIDNTTPDELSAWYRVVRDLHPRQVMIYVIDRATPEQNLEKISPERMQQIATPLRADGMDVLISC